MQDMIELFKIVANDKNPSILFIYALAFYGLMRFLEFSYKSYRGLKADNATAVDKLVNILYKRIEKLEQDGEEKDERHGREMQNLRDSYERQLSDLRTSIATLQRQNTEQEREIQDLKKHR